jgi:hypothetical protein
MAYKQNPGRGNNAKTGHGLPSPFKQMEIEVTKKYEVGKEKLAKNRETGNVPGGMTIEAESGKATPNLPMHKVVESGSNLRELDSAGKVVREIAKDTRGNKDFYKSVEDRNADVTRRQTRGANLYNAFSGGTKPENLSDYQKQTLVSLGKAVKK